MVDRDRQCCYFEQSAQRSGHFCLTLHVAMQLGLYLPGLTALSGVQSLRVPALRGPSLLIVRTRRIFTAGDYAGE